MNRKLVDALNAVAHISSELTLGKLTGRTLSHEEWAETRRNCRILAEADLYPFDISCSEQELAEQIAAFVKKGLEM